MRAVVLDQVVHPMLEHCVRGRLREREDMFRRVSPCASGGIRRRQCRCASPRCPSTSSALAAADFGVGGGVGGGFGRRVGEGRSAAVFDAPKEAFAEFSDSGFTARAAPIS